MRFVAPADARCSGPPPANDALPAIPAVPMENVHPKIVRAASTAPAVDSILAFLCKQEPRSSSVTTLNAGKIGDGPSSRMSAAKPTNNRVSSISALPTLSTLRSAGPFVSLSPAQNDLTRIGEGIARAHVPQNPGAVSSVAAGSSDSTRVTILSPRWEVKVVPPIDLFKDAPFAPCAARPGFSHISIAEPILTLLHEPRVGAGVDEKGAARLGRCQDQDGCKTCDDRTTFDDELTLGAHERRSPFPAAMMRSQWHFSEIDAFKRNVVSGMGLWRG